MKKFLIALFPMVMISSAAFCNSYLPNCWNKPTAFAEGKYNIDIFEDQAVPGAVEQVYELVNRGYLKADSEPYHLEAARRWWVRTSSFTLENVLISKEELQQAVEGQLFPLTKMHGVVISCRPILHPR